jgi:hypothetical protein
MSSNISVKTLVDSRALANLGFVVKLWSRWWADSRVEEFWQCKRTSSRIEMIGPHLGRERDPS